MSGPSMSRVFLTGATGMIGSNIAEQLVEQGDTVRALVREGSDTAPLEAFGVEVVRGDITDADAVLARRRRLRVRDPLGRGAGRPDAGRGRARGGERRGHRSRARRRGQGRRHPGRAAQHHDVLRRPDVRRSPSTRRSTRTRATIPYTVTKRAAYLDAMRRVDDGQDICIVISGGAYGMLPAARAVDGGAELQRPHRARAGRGEITEYVGFPIPWVVRGRRRPRLGRRHPQGRGGGAVPRVRASGDVGGVPCFCNAALEIAGSRPPGDRGGGGRARRSRGGGPLRSQPGGAGPEALPDRRSS